MGGGPEYPQRGEHERELLLCVLPWPEKASEKVIGEIRDEFPNLEMHYIAQTYEDLKTGKTEVPEGNTPCPLRAVSFCTTAPFPLSRSALSSLIKSFRRVFAHFSLSVNHSIRRP